MPWSRLRLSRSAAFVLVSPGAFALPKCGKTTTSGTDRTADMASRVITTAFLTQAVCYLLVSLSMVCPFPAQGAEASAQEIRAAATRAVTLLQLSQKNWKLDCRSCHH